MNGYKDTDIKLFEYKTYIEQKVTGGTALTTTSDGFPVRYGFISATKTATANIGSNEQISLGATQEAILWIRRLSAVGAIIIKNASLTVTEEW